MADWLRESVFKSRLADSQPLLAAAATPVSGPEATRPVPVPPSVTPAIGDPRRAPAREGRRIRPEDRRILELERKLEAVLRQLDELKRSMRGQRNDRDPTAPGARR